ncbi:phosphoadenosine phosphosulfate reductase family protein [Pseudodesulfovibrio sediminis]|uniref:Phosphoadenosine phosphosulphate reductase domain-containing protein n=1 Tax=Pseudodesulfovibrio sediminis TaxID=2810563 RepID=A0ABN6EPL3_9BACT|nr:phosphoadenosine phosphosulfate reductase family protein [Pseudodesulfovibrio sediminis]BCS87362.1 hypothetical protein PSDVSF_06040 [Pseudodesulfovibrio sediminis]
MTQDVITAHEYAERIAWPLERKIKESWERIAAWVSYWGKEASLSFSGGWDSTVLLHLARTCPHIDGHALPVYFADTGTEYPDIRKFVKSTPGVTWVRPKMKFHEVIGKYGYPVVSKRVAQYVGEVQRANTAQIVRLRTTGWRENGTHSPMSTIPQKWQFLIGAPFKVSDKCCDKIKKAAMKGTGHALVGVRAAEAKNREKVYLQYGCNAFDIDRPRSWPMAFWTDEDVREYTAVHNLEYCPIYDLGYHRTGCFPCAFGVHLEPWPNRFQLMQKTHPRLWNLCMDRYGFQMVFEFMNEWLPAKQQISFHWSDYTAREARKHQQAELPMAV